MPKFRKNPDDVRETLSVRLTPGLRADVEASAQALGVTLSLYLRHCILEALDLQPWPPLADPRSDEDTDIGGAPMRIPPSMRGEIARYQSATGARDLSAAVRSLIATGARLPVGAAGVRMDA